MDAIEKLKLIDKIRSARYNDFTGKQLTTLSKIIDEFNKTDTIEEEKRLDCAHIRDSVTELRDKYKNYLEETGYVENGIEYTWLKALNDILESKD